MTPAQRLVKSLQLAATDTPFTVCGTRRGLVLVVDPVLGQGAHDEDHLQAITYSFLVNLNSRTHTGTVSSFVTAEPVRAGDPILDPSARYSFPELPEEWLAEELTQRGWHLQEGTEQAAAQPSRLMTFALLLIGLGLLAGALYLLLAR